MFTLDLLPVSLGTERGGMKDKDFASTSRRCGLSYRRGQWLTVGEKSPPWISKLVFKG